MLLSGKQSCLRHCCVLITYQLVRRETDGKSQQDEVILVYLFNVNWMRHHPSLLPECFLPSEKGLSSVPSVAQRMRQHPSSAFELHCKCVFVCNHALVCLYLHLRMNMSACFHVSKIIGPRMCARLFICVLFPKSCRAYDNWWWLIQTFAYVICRICRETEGEREREKEEFLNCMWEVVLGCGLRQCVGTCLWVCVFVPRRCCWPHWPLRKALEELLCVNFMCRDQYWLNTLIRTKHLSVKILFILREDNIWHWLKLPENG